MRVALLLLLLAGCVDVPEPEATCDHGEDEDGDGWVCDGALPDCDDSAPMRNPGAVETGTDDLDCDPRTDGTGTLAGVVVGADDSFVRSADVEISFAGGLISDVLRDDATMLSSGSDEPGIGLAFYPAYASFGSGGSDPGTITDFAPVTYAFEDFLEAQISDANVRAQTYWYAYPNGRFVRHDYELRLFDEVPAGAESYYVSSYLSFLDRRFDHVRTSASDTPILIPGLPHPTSIPVTLPDDGDSWVCAYDSASGNAMVAAWLARGGLGPRVTFGDDGRLALEYDWYRDQPGPLPTGIHQATTFLQFVELGDDPTDTCSIAPSLVEPFLHPASITITPPGVPLYPSFEDDSSDGFWESEGIYTVDGGLNGGHTPASFAEWTFDGATRDATTWVELTGRPGIGVSVWRDGERLRRDVDYLIQIRSLSDNDIYLMLWLPGDIPAGTRIRVASPGGEP